MLYKNKQDSEISELNSFSRRHIGVSVDASKEMLRDIGFSSMDEFIQSIVPNNIYNDRALNLSLIHI